MKVWSFLVVLVTLFFSFSASAEGLPDVTAHPACPYCGMDRQKFAHSRMVIEYDDGTTVGTCSIHCTAIELANKIDIAPAAIKVGDYNSKELIDAEQAVWVLGGDADGVMTARAKWAFAGKEAAAAFVAAHGGSIVTFDEAMKASYEDMYTDTVNIRKKRKNKKMKMGNPAAMPQVPQH